MEGMFRATRDAPPLHLLFTVESFSTLASSSLQKCKSCVFEAADHKWRVVLYPKGKRTTCVNDHISIYLLLDDENIPSNDILVNFSLLLFDRIREKYLSFHQVGNFCEEKYEFGIDKFVPLKIFNDPCSGYLDNDTCVFGAEVFVIKNEPKCHCLSMMPSKPAPFKFTWKIEKFSELEVKYHSKIFTTRGYDWQLCIEQQMLESDLLCWKSNFNAVVLFLDLVDSAALQGSGLSVIVDYKLYFINDLNLTIRERQGTGCFDSSNKSLEIPCFLINGSLANNTFIVKVELIVLGSSR